VATHVASFRKRENEAPLSTPQAATSGRTTREVGIRELKNKASEVIDRVASGERAVVTRRNEPAAVILSIDEALEFVLAHAEDFVLARRQARDGNAIG